MADFVSVFRMVEHFLNVLKLLSFGCKYQFVTSYGENKMARDPAPTGAFFCSKPLILCCSVVPLCDDAVGPLLVPTVSGTVDLVRVLQVATGNSFCADLDKNVICKPCSLLLLWHLLSDQACHLL